MKTETSNGVVIQHQFSDSEVTYNNSSDRNDVSINSDDAVVNDDFKAQMSSLNGQNKFTNFFLDHRRNTVPNNNKNKSHSALYEETLSVYDVVHQDILSMFENKVIAVSEPEKILPGGNVQVISFVSDEENISHGLHENFNVKNRKQADAICVSTKDPSTKLSLLPSKDKQTNRHQFLNKSFPNQESEGHCSTKTLFLCKVRTVQQEGSQKKLCENPRYSGDVKIHSFTTPAATEKCISLVKNNALKKKKKLLAVQLKNSKMKKKIQCLQDLLIKLTEESIK